MGALKGGTAALWPAGWHPRLPAALPPAATCSHLHPAWLAPPTLQNLEVLYRQYGRDGNRHGLDWQEVAVCIIQDGESACDASIVAASTVQGFYSENLKQEEAVGLPVSMHIWEYTARWVSGWGWAVRGGGDAPVWRALVVGHEPTDWGPAGASQLLPCGSHHAVPTPQVPSALPACALQVQEARGPGLLPTAADRVCAEVHQPWQA